MMATSLQHRSSNKRLKILDRPTDGRLCNAESPSRGGVAQFLGDGLKIAQVPEVHGDERDHTMASR